MAKKFDTSIGGGNRMFPSTMWSMVLHAGDARSPEHRKDLESLLGLYWKPVYCYMKAIRRKGSEDAKDLAQGFFTRLLEKETLGKLSPERGTFRGFLKEAIRNFLVDAHRHDSARRPQGGVFLQIEEFRDTDQAIDETEDPQAVFDREWDRTLLENALEALETRMQAENNGEAFSAFRLYCLPETSSEGKQTYADIGRQMGLAESVVRKRLARCRSELREIMKDQIRDYAYDDQQADEEYRRMVGE